MKSTFAVAGLLALSGAAMAQQGDGTRVAIAASIFKPAKVEATPERIAALKAPAGFVGREAPDAVFIGGGLSEALLETLCASLPNGTRLVANAVTLESEAVLTRWHGLKGGTLLRIELSEATPLGTRRGWHASYPVVQWSVVL